MSALQCEICGRFISYDALEHGWAIHKLLTPDSAFTAEEWETYHVRCMDRLKRNYDQRRIQAEL